MRKLKLFTLLAALCCSMTMWAAPISCGDGLTWSYADGTLTISYDGQGTGAMDDFTVSAATNYDPSYPWINFVTEITSVVVNEGVTKIGNLAFSDFTNLVSVSLPSTLQTIGSSAFADCSKLPSITLPANVTSIGMSAFSYCTLLTSANIPAGVTCIPESLFYDCHALQTVAISEGLETIDRKAFYRCSSLTELTFPSTLTQIGYASFNWAGGPSSITLPASLVSIGAGAFCGFSSLTNVTMLGTTPATLGESAFSTFGSSLTFTVPTCELIDTYAAAGYNTFVGTNYQSFATSIVSATGACGASSVSDQQTADVITTTLQTLIDNGSTEDDLTIIRPVYKNTYYNTLCFPFSMTAEQIAASPLAGATIKECTGAQVVDDELQIVFSDVTAIVAGTPYFVSYENAEALTQMDFTDVDVTTITAGASETYNGVTFKGTFVPFAMPAQTANSYSYLFLGQNNTLFWPNVANNLLPFRCYFEINTGSNAPVRRGMNARIVESTSNATGVEQGQSDKVQSTKVLRDGQLIIIKNGVEYNAQGMMVSE